VYLFRFGICVFSGLAYTVLFLCCVRFSFFSTSQEIGWEERLRNDLFLCRVGRKSVTQSVYQQLWCRSCCPVNSISALKETWSTDIKHGESLALPSVDQPSSFWGKRYHILCVGSLTLYLHWSALVQETSSRCQWSGQGCCGRTGELFQLNEKVDRLTAAPAADCKWKNVQRSGWRQHVQWAWTGMKGWRWDGRNRPHQDWVLKALVLAWVVWGRLMFQGEIA